MCFVCVCVCVCGSFSDVEATVLVRTVWRDDMKGESFRGKIFPHDVHFDSRFKISKSVLSVWGVRVVKKKLSKRWNKKVSKSDSVETVGWLGKDRRFWLFIHDPVSEGSTV